ncbi:MAG: hypothetical protein AVDCRST_MAG20-2560, partial [uncultured Acidimicrobiales bacterium]
EAGRVVRPREARAGRRGCTDRGGDRRRGVHRRGGARTVRRRML